MWNRSQLQNGNLSRKLLEFPKIQKSVLSQLYLRKNLKKNQTWWTNSVDGFPRNNVYYLLATRNNNNRLNEEIQAKRSHIDKNVVPPVPLAINCKIAWITIPVGCTWYLPDLTMSDFFQFPNLKKWLAGKKTTCK